MKRTEIIKVETESERDETTEEKLISIFPSETELKTDKKLISTFSCEVELNITRFLTESETSAKRFFFMKLKKR